MKSFDIIFVEKYIKETLNKNFWYKKNQILAHNEKLRIFNLLSFERLYWDCCEIRAFKTFWKILSKIVENISKNLLWKVYTRSWRSPMCLYRCHICNEWPAKPWKCFCSIDAIFFSDTYEAEKLIKKPFWVKIYIWDHRVNIFRK